MKEGSVNRFEVVRSALVHARDLDELRHVVEGLESQGYICDFKFTEQPVYDLEQGLIGIPCTFTVLVPVEELPEIPAAQERTWDIHFRVEG